MVQSRQAKFFHRLHLGKSPASRGEQGIGSLGSGGGDVLAEFVEEGVHALDVAGVVSPELDHPRIRDPFAQLVDYALEPIGGD